MSKLSATIEGDDLVIRIKRNQVPSKSSTGKTLIVASSSGNVQTDLEVDGKPVIIGLNAYIYNPNYVKPPK
jgi:hypothetical protein